MCDQTEIKYVEGEVVWVKFGSCWWPGEVVGPNFLPPDVLTSFRKPPIAVVKFFDEDAYEYVKDINCIYKYHCSRKNEFIKKGLDLYRLKHGHMEKFPKDVVTAETRTDGDADILEQEQFQETKKKSYAGLFGDPAKTPTSGKKGSRKGKNQESPQGNIHRLIKGGNADYKVHILLQGSKSETIEPVPSTSKVDIPAAPAEEQKEVSSSPSMSVKCGLYTCHACPFTTIRLNVMIIHNKSHSLTFTPYTPTPVSKTPKSKLLTPKSVSNTSTSGINISKTPVVKRVHKNKEPNKEKALGLKRTLQEKHSSKGLKKVKTDNEFKSSLLADWDDEWLDAKNESVKPASSPDIPVSSESPAAPVSTECSVVDISTKVEICDKSNTATDSRYDFREDEDWPLEADIGRKIPRVKNSCKAKNDFQSHIDDNDVAKEVAELLDKTTVPELPLAPEIPKFEENFPEPPVTKSPDKTNNNSMECTKSINKIDENVTKTIFKTKTFFRSRHSRSQDAIEKYVAEQLNSTEKIDSLNSEINEEETSPAIIESLPEEPVKVTRMAPKIQLKKMKAEAAQIKEITNIKEKNSSNVELSLSAEPCHKLNSDIIQNDLDNVQNNKKPKYNDINLLEDSVIESEVRESETDPNMLLMKLTESKETDSPITIQQNLNSLENAADKNEACNQSDHTFRENPFTAIEQNLILESSTYNKTEICDNSLQDNPLTVIPHLITLDSATDSKVKVCGHGDNSLQENLSNVIQQHVMLLGGGTDNKREVCNNGDDSLGENPSTAIQQNVLSLGSSIHDINEVCNDGDGSLLEDPSTDIQQNVLSLGNSTDDKNEVSNGGGDSLQDNPSVAIQQNVSLDSATVNINEVCNSNDNSLQNNSSYVIEQSFISVGSNTHNKLNSLQELPSIPIEQNVLSLASITDDKNEVQADNYLQENSSTAIQLNLISSESDTDNKNMVCSHVDYSVEENPSTANEQNSTVVSATNNINEVFNQGDNVIQENDDCITTECITNSEVVELLLHPPCEIQNIKQNKNSLLQESSEYTVDTLLSVTHGSNIVTHVTTSDPPDELFENEITADNVNNKENINGISHINGECNKIVYDRSNLTQEGCIIDTEIQTIIREADEVTNKSHLLKNYINNKTMPSLANDVNFQGNTALTFLDNTPSESDLQVAEALINLPSTHTPPATVQGNTVEEVEVSSDVYEMKTENEKKEQSVTCFMPLTHKRTTALKSDIIINDVTSNVTLSETFNDNTKTRYDIDDEQSENLNAAKSLVQMSETVDHKLTNVDNDTVNTMKLIHNLKKPTPKFAKDVIIATSDQITIKTSDTNHTNIPNVKPASKLLQILEKPNVPSVTRTTTKSLIIPGPDKIINFEVLKSANKDPHQMPNHNVVIRRAPSSKKIINNLNECSQDKLILSRKNTCQDDSSIQTYTIQASLDSPSDANTIISQQKLRKISKPAPKSQLKSQSILIGKSEEKIPVSNVQEDEAIFDINSMPIILSDDIVNLENVDKMPVVMSDGNIITNTLKTQILKPKQTVKEIDKLPSKIIINKTEGKTVKMNTVSEACKSPTPNILSKSSKLRASKPLSVLDKTSGKPKIIMTKPESTIKEIKQTTIKTSTQGRQSTGKTEKYIILPTSNAPSAGRTQKIVIDPKTGKACILVAKSSTPPGLADNKPISAKVISSPSEAGTSSGTVMIITNAQGTQSRIVLTPEHEKILFPNHQTKLTQIKAIPQHHVNNITSAQRQCANITSTVSSPLVTKTQTRIVPKQKSTIITSKGQLIVGGRLAATITQSKSPISDIKPAIMQKRIIKSDSTKTVQSTQKNSPGEPLIFLKQKSGAIIQLTTAQYEHFQKTGQIIQQTNLQPVRDKKIIVQKSAPIQNETVLPIIKKHRSRAAKAPITPPPAKKLRHEINIAPSPIITKMPALSPLTTTNSSTMQTMIISEPVTSENVPYTGLDNFEELLPSTAIVRQPDPLPQANIVMPTPDPVPPVQLSDGQLSAVPSEYFGGLPGSFYLCVEDNGNYIAIDNRPLILENNQLVPMTVEPVSMLAQPERRDILEAALANSDVFHADPPREEAPDFRDLNANVSVHCKVSETSSTLHQPIMTPVEVPTKGDTEPIVPSNLEDGLAVIGVTPQTVPTSLELPITVTDPRIAPKAADPLSIATYGPTLLSTTTTEMNFVESEEIIPAGPISMPLLTEDDAGIGKSMPILTDEINERTASSVDSTVDSPSSIDVRESELEESSNWSHHLLTPGSDTSETSSEIPLQPVIQLSANNINSTS